MFNASKHPRDLQGRFTTKQVLISGKKGVIKVNTREKFPFNIEFLSDFPGVPIFRRKV